MDDAAGQAFAGIHDKVEGVAEGVGKVSSLASLLVSLM